MEEDFSIYNGEGTTLRRAQLRMLEILKEVDLICRRNKIPYWIDYGTLLGAVRHLGFIPWDDDLDICMMGEDLQRFIAAAKKELPENLFLQLKETDPSYNLSLCKIRDKNSFLVTQHDDFTRDYQKGLYIDIFEATEYPNIPPTLLKPLMKWIKKCSFFKTVKHEMTAKNIMASLSFPVIGFLCGLVWKILNLKKKTKIGYIPKLNYYGVSYKKEMIFPLTEIEFEGGIFMAPNNADAYLREIYGDYTKLPPVEKRITHSIFIQVK